MLKVKSFSITDDAGINALLTTNRIAPGAHILVSEGNICIPYEDGEAPNKAQQIIAIKEMKHEEQRKVDLILHSQRVLEIQVKGIQAEIDKADAEIVAPKGKKEYDSKKKYDAEKRRLQTVLDQTKNQILMNQAELTRLTTNLAVFDERVAALGETK